MNPSLWGIAIPGLAMAAKEVPAIEGVRVLENPGIGECNFTFPGAYRIEDIARTHLKAIQELQSQGSLRDPVTLIGMSMGGMILSVLASKFRKDLPANAAFRFLVTTANSADLPAVPDSALEKWRAARPGVVESFRPILRPFFSRQFVQTHPAVVDDYIAYRGVGGNRQTPSAFMQQLSALRSSDCSSFFAALNGSECTFIGGAEDYVLGPKHNQKLKELVPAATHIEIPGLGHMINLEAPEFFREKLPERR